VCVLFQKAYFGEPFTRVFFPLILGFNAGGTLNILWGRAKGLFKFGGLYWALFWELLGGVLGFPPPKFYFGVLRFSGAPF